MIGAARLTGPVRIPNVPDDFPPCRPVSEPAVPVLEGVRYSETILDAVGRTPLVRLRAARVAMDNAR